MKRLTPQREKEIREVLKNFPTVQAEKRTGIHSFPELVDVKPHIEELLGEVEALREDSKALDLHRENYLAVSKQRDSFQQERDSLKEALKVAKEALDNTHKHLESTNSNTVTPEHKSWFKDALDKIKGLEKR